MDKIMNKSRTAQYLRVSMPTLRKFLKRHPEIMMGTIINTEKLKNWIMRECSKPVCEKEK